MSGHDDLGFDADLGHGRDVLKQTIGALVDGATPAGVPSTPEENLGLLRRRVRTWRIAKAGAVGLTGAVVVGALAFSTAQASTWTRSEPLPGRPTIESTERGPVPSEIPTSRMSPSPSASASPSPSSSPSSTPEATPSGGADVDPDPEPSASSVKTDPADVITAPFDDGYRPWGVDDDPTWCGMPDTDLVSTSPSVSIEITGDLTYARGEGGSIPVRLTGEMPGYNWPEGSEGIGNGAILIWSQGGRVVDLGEYWREANYEIPPALNETGAWTGVAEANSYSSCIEADREEGLHGYDNVRAAGTYQVRAAQVHTVGDGKRELLFSEPVTVTIP
ncbi:hypothetical protein ACQEVI_13470 [Promicromonospora sp. CA-289599]|uniref:hypothetical protein n=1 Tax=Promicromonospora sp. CA-289599 TaxID=3240014 RepID=UPI003D94B474